MAGMIANIINNLQVTVRNIHLRYEDKLSTPDVRHRHLISSLPLVPPR
jgi:hypothetical protein